MSSFNLPSVTLHKDQEQAIQICKEIVKKERFRMKLENTLMAYKENIESRGFWDWIKAHTSFMKPLHRYQGVLELNEKNELYRMGSTSYKINPE